MLDFIGIGAQKAGTTWLYENLNRHPEIHFPAGKEVHYWNARIETESEDWYRGLFEGFPDTRNGEITPAYSILPEERVEGVGKSFPRLKAILILRNPKERAWSSALMAVRRSEMKFQEASHQWFLDHVRSSGSLARGDYLPMLRRWEKYFPGRLLVLRYEEIEKKPLDVLNKCCELIGVSTLQQPSWDIGERVFAGEKFPIPAVVRDELERLYLPRILALEEYLGWDLSGWRRD